MVLPGEGYIGEELSKLPVSLDIIPYPWWTVKPEADKQILWEEIIDSSARIAETVSNFSPEVIYTNTSVIPQGALVAGFLKIPHIWHIKEYGEKDHNLVFLLDVAQRAKFIYDYSDKIIFSSKRLKTYFEQFINPLKSAIVGPYIVHHDNGEEQPKIFNQDNSLKLLLIGQIQPGKGQLEALKAVKHCLKHYGHEVSLAIVGGISSPDYYQEIQSFIHDNDLVDSVAVRGFLPNPMGAFQEAEVVLICSRSEAFGRVTVEAMRLGKPVIGANAGGTPEVIKHQKTGLLYEAGNYKDLAEKIDFLYKNRNKISELGSNAKKFVDDKLTEEEYCGKMYDIMFKLKKKAVNGNMSIDIYPEIISRYNKYIDKYNTISSAYDAVCHNLETLNNNIQQKGREIDTLRRELERKDQEINTQRGLLEAKEQTITCLLGSRCWRLTRPLRRAHAAVLRWRHLVVASAERAYDATPLPPSRRTQITNLVFTHFGFFFRGTDRYEHWLQHRNDRAAGQPGNLEPIETYYEKVPDAVDRITGLTFGNPEAPLVSIVIPVFNNWRYTYACLQAVRERSGEGIPYEVIVADDGSRDDTYKMLKRIKGIHIILNKINLGFLRNCNNAATQARGRYLLLLNNDTEVQDGWLEPLVKVFESFDNVGMVGSKLLYSNGQLQEAGGIIWNDGTGWNFGRGDDPGKPEYNYVREVDYCSGASILIRKELWNKLGGFDEQFKPIYCEDSDLAFQIREAGYRVFYQPESRVVHHEGIVSGTDPGSGLKRYQALNLEKLFRKWQATFKAQSTCPEELFLARDRSQDKKIILVIDDKVPEYDQHAGGLTTYQYVRLFCDMGFKVVFLPDNLYPMAPYTSELQQLGVEVLYGNVDINEWLARYGKYLHFVWLARPEVASKYIDILKASSNSKILYYTHDLHHLRERRRYELDHNPDTFLESRRLKKLEFGLFAKVDVILTPSSHEELVIRESFPYQKVFTIPPYFYEFPPENAEPGVDFPGRDGILFLGGFGHTPNVDAVWWFVQEILPRVRERLPEVTFTAAGSHPSPEILALQNERVRVTGYVPDLRPLFEKARVFVAPLRYGAGVKGKIVNSLVYGVPVVTTSIGNEGLDLAHGREALIADEPEAFAAQIVELYANKALWERLASGAQDYVRRHFGAERARKLLKDVLEICVTR